jgi:hypothetical protein
MDLLRSWLRGADREARVHVSAQEGGGGVIKEAPMVIDGRCLTIEQFITHVDGLTFPYGVPNRIFLHHTWRPTRETWRGLSTILGMKAYYERQLWVDEQGRWHEGWTAGPHLFIADDGIWLFSDLNYDGVGVAGHNRDSLHIEMVGNFDVALPDGPMWQNTVAALGALHDRIGLPPEKLNFHRDYSTKTCPGLQVQKAWVIPQVRQWLAEFRAKREAREPSLRRRLRDLASELLLPDARGTALADAARDRGLLGPISREVPVEVGGQAFIIQLYAEALVVPVNRWDEVQSLAEFEQQPLQDEARMTAAEDADLPIYDVTVPPGDVIDFQGLR